MSIRQLFGSLVLLSAFAACKEGNGPVEVGPPADIAVTAGANQSAPANTTLPTNIQVTVVDANGHPVPSQTVNFSILSGGGTLIGSNTVTAGTDGVATAPAWRLGKSATGQFLRVTSAGLLRDIPATVQSEYNIEVRFWGDPMSTTQQALFINARDRIRGIVTGDIIGANAQNVDLQTFCGVSGQPPMNEVIDDIVIYASVSAIDGPAGVVARAGWCLGRNTTAGFMPAVGVMQFDVADFGGSALQDVITHEMLHVIGVGTLWEDRMVLDGAGGIDPRYTGPQGRTGCQAVGGTISCSSSVPVENTGGAGTADGHWREVTFDNELMTGIIDNGVMPLSSITVNSLADLGYVINFADFDAYTIAAGALRAQSAAVSPIPHADWEKPLDLPKHVIEPNGQLRKIVRPR